MFNSACNVISHSRIYKEGLGHKFIDHHVHCVPVTVNMASNNSSDLPELATSFEVNSYIALNTCLLISHNSDSNKHQIIIKHGLSKVKLLPLIAAIVILWVVVVLTSIPYLTPAYQYEAFRKGILVCDTTLTWIAYVHIALSILFIDIPGRFISVCTIIAAVIHVKRNTVTDFSPIIRSFLRFTVILLCINILFCSQTLLVYWDSCCRWMVTCLCWFD